MKLSQITNEKERSVEALIHLVAHQMRNPLAVAMGSISLLDDDLPKEMQKEVLRDIKKSIDRLNRIVGSFLTIAKFESEENQLELVETNISNILEEAVNCYRSDASLKNIQLTLFIQRAKTHTLACDRKKILQAVGNLIDNAIKYSPKNSRVTVKLVSNTQDVRIQVTDFGIGFSTDERKSLFTKRFRTEAAKKFNRRGIGFGLYLVKRIIDAHRGSIYASSPGPNTGSTFSIVLAKNLMANHKSRKRFEAFN